MPLSYYTKYTNQKTEDISSEVADWNMAYFHFQRYHELLKFADDCAISVLGFNKTAAYKPAIDLYYSSLRTLFLNLRPNMLPNVVDDIENKFVLAKEERLKFMNQINPIGIIIFPTGLIEILEEIHADLVFIMYRHLGLGYPLTRNEPRKTLIKRKLVEG